MNAAGQCLMTLSQTYGYLNKQIYSFLVFFVFNTAIVPEDVLEFHSPTYRRLFYFVTIYFCSPFPTSTKIPRDLRRIKELQSVE